LKNVTPDESNVIFQLAKVYRLVGDVVKSAQLLAAARDVSPKSVGKIRRLVDVDREMEVDSS
jgi:anaphase-promoting complex subunit 3